MACCGSGEGPTAPLHRRGTSAAATDGEQPGRLARYASNCATLVQGMTALGLRAFLEPSIQAPIIVTFHAPTDPQYTFAEFYDRVRDTLAEMGITQVAPAAVRRAAA